MHYVAHTVAIPPVPLFNYTFFVGEPIASAQSMLIRNITLKHNQELSPQHSDEYGGLI